jgi:hypothetical protein
VLLLVYALAVYRLTRLLIADQVLEPLRTGILVWAQPEQGRQRPMLAYFVTCPWCVSMWVAAGWLLLASLAGPVAWYLGAALAFSAITGLLAGRE